MTIKSIVKTVGLSILGITLLGVLFSAWVDVDPGQEGFFLPTL
jgi:mannose/fructose/N-acetylgalactosamine-specific phosphotransferase system component IID